MIGNNRKVCKVRSPKFHFQKIKNCGEKCDNFFCTKEKMNNASIYNSLGTPFESKENWTLDIRIVQSRLFLAVSRALYLAAVVPKFYQRNLQHKYWVFANIMRNLPPKTWILSSCFNWLRIFQHRENIQIVSVVVIVYNPHLQHTPLTPLILARFIVQMKQEHYAH